MRKINRYFLKHNTYNYVKVLGALTKSYNNSYHRSIKMAPSSVSLKNIEEVRQHLYRTTPFEDSTRPIFFKFSVGSHVHISAKQSIFRKAFRANFIPTIYIITRRFRRGGLPLYKLKDKNGVEITGSFYTQELVTAVV